MSFILRMMENAAKQTERGELGGIVTFPTCQPMPCSIGADKSSLQRADNSAGFNLNQSRQIVVRTALLKDLARQPQSGDEVTVKGKLETDAVTLTIADISGVESCNGILTVCNLYNPNP